MKNKTEHHEPQIDWKRATRRVPVANLLEDCNLDDPINLSSVADGFQSMLQNGTYLVWEAVIRDEQGLPLSHAQKKLIDGLICLGDEEDWAQKIAQAALDGYDDPEHRVRYIDRLARPSEPWYAAFRRIASKLLVPVFRTEGTFYDVHIDGWPRLQELLEEHAIDLSLPPDTASPMDVLPLGLRHRLNVQICFLVLIGVGRYRTLVDQPDLIDELIDALREQRVSVAELRLTLNDLLELIEMPAPEKKILTDLLRDKLKIVSADTLLADSL